MSYLGSKAASGARQAILALMPPHHTYIETHLGSGAVMAAKPPAALNIGIDIDEQALSLAAGQLQGYAGDLRLECADAHEFLRSRDFDGRELVYCDPPYLPSTRSSRARYRYDYTEAQHAELLDLLKGLGTQVMISGYPSAMYDDLLRGWNSYAFQVMTRGGVRTEKLWFNYEPDARYWSGLAGRNFTHRQQIRRKAQRWAGNFRKMPPEERQAVLAAMLQTEVN